MTVNRFFMHMIFPVLLASVFYCTPVQAQLLADDAHSTIPAPSLSARSWVLMEADTGIVLAENKLHMKVEPASLTKLMVSYLAFERIKNGALQLDEEILVSEKAWKAVGSRMFIEVGKRVTVHDLLKGLIVQSGNDAAIALAEYMAGSEAGFAELMNQKAKTLGMLETHYTNAPGMPDGEHYTSAYDVALISRAIIQEYPEFYAWYSEPEFTYNNITQGNRNLLLKQDPSVDGIKTGFTETAGYCLAASSVKNGMRLIAVVTGTDSARERASQAASLLNFGHAAYEPVTVLRQARNEDVLPVYYGEVDTVAFGPKSPQTIIIPKGSRETLSLAFEVPEYIEAPVAEDMTIGKAKVVLNQATIYEFDLVSLNGVAEGGLLKQGIDFLKLQLDSLW